MGRRTKDKKETIISILKKYRILAHEQPTGCYEWRGALRDGFPPYINVNGTIMGAHRAAWIVEYGEIPEHHYVIHACKNKACTNPKHLIISRKKKLETSLSKRTGRERISVDLPEKLVQNLKRMARKYNQTFTKYLYRRLSEVMAYEEKIDRKEKK